MATRHISNISIAHEDQAYKTPSSPSTGFLTTPLPSASLAFKNPTRNPSIFWICQASAIKEYTDLEFARGLTLSPLIFVLPPPQWPRAKIPRRRYTVARRSASTTIQWLLMLVRNQSSYNGDGCGGHAKVAGVRRLNVTDANLLAPSAPCPAPSALGYRQKTGLL